MGVRSEHHLNRAGSIPWECMLKSVGDELVHDETEWYSLLGRQIKLRCIDVDGDRPDVPERIREMSAELH